MYGGYRRSPDSRRTDLILFFVFLTFVVGIVITVVVVHVQIRSSRTMMEVCEAKSITADVKLG